MHSYVMVNRGERGVVLHPTYGIWEEGESRNPVLLDYMGERTLLCMFPFISILVLFCPPVQIWESEDTPGHPASGRESLVFLCRAWLPAVPSVEESDTLISPRAIWYSMQHGSGSFQLSHNICSRNGFSETFHLNNCGLTFREANIVETKQSILPQTVGQAHIVTVLP